MRNSDLRVISGIYKGQRLHSPESAHTHPMGNREKLALFNMLQPFLAAGSAKCLDLYAGSGALGIEALSRGAREVVFIEKSPRVARLISENLASLKSSQVTDPNAQVLIEDAASFCSRREFVSYFDIIIADPPYDNFHPEDFASISQMLAPGGVLALSSPAKSASLDLPGLTMTSTHTYAAARLTLYRL